jgi:hypothetical protein
MPEYEVELERNRIVVERATVHVTANDKASARTLALEAAEADWDLMETWEDRRKVLHAQMT